LGRRGLPGFAVIFPLAANRAVTSGRLAINWPSVNRSSLMFRPRVREPHSADRPEPSSRQAQRSTLPPINSSLSYSIAPRILGLKDLNSYPQRKVSVVSTG
jgi:hypothetical protein